MTSSLFPKKIAVKQLVHSISAIDGMEQAFLREKGNPLEDSSSLELSSFLRRGLEECSRTSAETKALKSANTMLHSEIEALNRESERLRAEVKEVTNEAARLRSAAGTLSSETARQRSEVKTLAEESLLLRRGLASLFSVPTMADLMISDPPTPRPAPGRCRESWE